MALRIHGLPPRVRSILNEMLRVVFAQEERMVYFWTRIRGRSHPDGLREYAYVFKMDPDEAVFTKQMVENYLQDISCTFENAQPFKAVVAMSPRLEFAVSFDKYCHIRKNHTIPEEIQLCICSYFEFFMEIQERAMTIGEKPPMLFLKNGEEIFIWDEVIPKKYNGKVMDESSIQNYIEETKQRLNLLNINTKIVCRGEYYKLSFNKM
jgi:hypothetical protein